MRRSLIFAGLLFGLILPLLATMWHSFELQRRLVEDAFEQEMAQVAKTAAQGMADPVWNLIPAAGEALARSIVADPRVLRIEVTSDVQGAFLAIGEAPTDGQAVEAFTAPITRDDAHIGEARVFVDPAYVDEVIAWQQREILVAAGVAIAFAFAVLFVVLRLYRRINAADAVEAANARLRQEVAERRKADAARTQSEARFRDFAEIASDWLWETDPNHRFVFVTPHTLGDVRVDPDELIGKTRFERSEVDPAADPFWKRHAEELEARREFRKFEYGFRLPSGQHVVLSVSGRPVFDEAGSFKGYRGVGTDVTEMRRMEADLREAIARAEAANEAKAAFMARMSHDLRTPLNAIIGFGEVIVADTLAPERAHRVREYAADIVNSGQYLLALVNDVLDISRIESGGVKLDMAPCDLGEVVHAAAARLRQDAAAKRLSLTIDLPTDLPRVVADELALGQVLTNLLSNAVKFTGEGASVRVSAAETPGGRVVVTVADTGRGMTTEELEAATLPFTTSQAEPGLYKPVEGVGLGLAIVQGLLDAMDADLNIESEFGVGTEVSFRLRCAAGSEGHAAADD